MFLRDPASQPISAIARTVSQYSRRRRMLWPVPRIFRSFFSRLCYLCLPRFKNRVFLSGSQPPRPNRAASAWYRLFQANSASGRIFFKMHSSQQSSLPLRVPHFVNFVSFVCFVLKIRPTAPRGPFDMASPLSHHSSKCVGGSFAKEDRPDSRPFAFIGGCFPLSPRRPPRPCSIPLLAARPALSGLVRFLG